MFFPGRGLKLPPPGRTYHWATSEVTILLYFLTPDSTSIYIFFIFNKEMQTEVYICVHISDLTV